MFFFDKIIGKKVLKSSILDDGDSRLEHFFTTKELLLKTLEPKNIEMAEFNKIKLANFLDISPYNLISPIQTHSSNIKIIDENFDSKEQILDDTDGLILTAQNKAIFLNFADCTPLIFYDKKQNIGAIAHAGWRGTAAMIAQKTVLKLEHEFGSKPDALSVAIGATISDCCYDVGEDVFYALKQTLSGGLDCFAFHNHKIYCNLKKINYLQLLAVGVKNIDVSDYCTSCNNDLFFSYRKENATTDRHSALLKLK